MDPVFISYRRLDGADDVTALAHVLRLGGVRIWRDLDNLTRGHPTEDEIRRAIREECGGVVCYITPRFLDSPFIWKVEIPEALERAGVLEERFPVLPVFVGLRPDHLASHRPYGEVLAALGGELLPGEATGDIQHPAFIRTARAVLRSSLDRVAGRLKAAGRPLRIAFATRQAVPPDPSEDLFLDWRVDFPQERPASVETWDRELLTALKDVKASLVDIVGPRPVALRGNAHLSAALAMGHTFSIPTGFTFEVEQRRQTGEVTIWSSVGRSDSADLKAHQLPGNLDADHALVLLSISRDVLRDAGNWLAGPDAPAFRRRLHVRPQYGEASRDFVRNGEHARGIASYVADRIIELRREVGQIHLLIAAPWTVALFLGQHLNACGPIHLYEHDKVTGSYAQACILA